VPLDIAMLPMLYNLSLSAASAVALNQRRAELWWCPGRVLGLCPLPNSSIEQWRMVVIVTGYTLFVTSQYDVIFTFANQRFGEICW